GGGRVGGGGRVPFRAAGGAGGTVGGVGVGEAWVVAPAVDLDPVVTVADAHAAAGVGADEVALDEGAAGHAEEVDAVEGVAGDDVAGPRAGAANGNGLGAYGVVHEDAALVADPGQAVGAHAEVIAPDQHIGA